tara:strand:+ start:1733 stop:2524 length:792 start_codon:yes stop_codon:yes gene_type:complete
MVKQIKTHELIINNSYAEIVLNRPDELNSINEDFLTEIPETLKSLEDDPEIRAVLIKSTGKAFCVGLDINLLKKAFSDDDYFSSVLKRLRSIYLQIESLSAPVVAVVDGVARAGGFELMLSADIIFASDASKIGDVHTNFSVPPGGGSTARLPKIVGPKIAKELIMTAKWLSVDELKQIGLVNKVVPQTELDKEVDLLVNSLIDKPRSIHKTVKEMVNTSLALDVQKGTENEIKIFKEYVFGGHDAKEGFWSYIENRDPDWKI